MKYLLPLLFLLLNNCFAQDLSCEDLLEKYAVKPDKVEFIDCKPGIGQSIFEANYKVSGKDSKEVEAILIQQYGMGELKFVCCGWEASSGHFTSEALKAINSDYTLEISMFANAEKQNESGTYEIEYDRDKLEFELLVRLMKI